MYKRYWICSGDCSKRFDDPEAFTGHLIRDHGTTDPPEALISEAEHVDGIETNGDCCLCGDKCKPLLELRDHLGEHQRQLALFALPPLESEEHEGVENSEEAARDHSSGNSTVGSEVQEDSDALAVGMEWEKAALPNTNIVQEREDRDLVESRAKERRKPHMSQHSLSLTAMSRTTSKNTVTTLREGGPTMMRRRNYNQYERNIRLIFRSV